MAFEMDIQPSQLVRLTQLNQIDILLRAKAIWLCVSCKTCKTRCPASVDLSRIQDGLRQLCVQSDVQPADHRAAAAANAMLATIADAGRMNEVAFMGRFKWYTKTLLERFLLGITMFLRGKLKLFANKSKSRKQVAKLVKQSMHAPLLPPGSQK